jgi:spore coat polysaccharide biosynthesis protein SpsF
MLGRVIDRLGRVTAPVDLVIATSDQTADDDITAFANDEGIRFYRGHPTDVAERCRSCARQFGFDRIARISGDSPFIDPGVIDRLLQVMADETPDVVTNVSPRSFPPGVSVEVFTIAALDRLMAETVSPADREHVTPYFYAHPDRFDIRNVSADVPFDSRVRLVVDTSGDIKRARWVFSRLGKRPETATLREIAGLAQQWDAGTDASAKGA